jgi:hypothetical protein
MPFIEPLGMASAQFRKQLYSSHHAVFFVMNQAKQCKCQAIFGHLIELLFIIRDMQASVSPHPITFLVVAFLKIIHAN